MKQMKTLKFWAKVGVWVLLLLPLLLVCGLLLIPKYTPNAPQEQIFTIRFSDLRTENELYVNQFLNSIKNNDGYLVIGTSETTKRKNGNYYGMHGIRISRKYTARSRITFIYGLVCNLKCSST